MSCASCYFFIGLLSAGKKNSFCLNAESNFSLVEDTNSCDKWVENKIKGSKQERNVLLEQKIIRRTQENKISKELWKM